MNIYEKLSNIQSELKAPKSQRNTFGNYNYRNCEDILEAVKPLCKTNQVVLTVTDDIIEKNGRYYIMATATLTDFEGNNIINTAFAREEETKKGMDASQITGSASSYARKYALNGLFAIDDTKNADATNKHEKEVKATKEQITKLKELVEDIPAMLNYYKIDKIENLPKDKADEIINRKSS